MRSDLSVNPAIFEVPSGELAQGRFLRPRMASRFGGSDNRAATSIDSGWLASRRLRFAAFAILVVCGALLVVSVCTARQNQTVFGPTVGGDYAAFYNAGRLVNQSPRDLYNQQAHSRLYHGLFPKEPAEAGLPFANAPAFAILFSPLARLPYVWSYLLWTLISLALFVSGFVLAWDAVKLPRKYFATGLLLALSFEPFVIECLHGGQVSAVAFFCICLAIWLRKKGWLISAGAAVGLCLYKPTLLPLLIPMLLIGRQWRMLIGAAGAAGLATGVSVLVLGREVNWEYARLLTGYLQRSTGGQVFFQTWKFVDLNSFLKLLSHGPSSGAWGVMGMIGALVGWRLVRLWRSFGQSEKGGEQAWAATLTCTLFLNVYVGVYDTILVIPAILLMLGRDHLGLSRAHRWLLPAIYLAPWFSGLLAHGVGFQPYTLLLMALGALQLRGPTDVGRTCPFSSGQWLKSEGNGAMTFA